MSDPVHGVSGSVFAHLVKCGPSTTSELAAALKGEQVMKPAPAVGARGHRWEPIKADGEIMAKFKKLTLGRMPRVFVAILAHEEVETINQAIVNALPVAVRDKVLPASSPAAFLHGILELPREERAELVPVIDGVLEELADQDFFGTEGQLDPRGDRRG